MKIYALTKKGPAHFENEDRVVVGKTILADGFFETEIDAGIIAIADGVGGQNAGAVASHFLATNLSEYKSIRVDDLKGINEKLIKKSQNDINLTNMATTLSLLMINDKKYIYHIGNTRIYCLKGGKYLRQLTMDDTSVNYLISVGKLSQEEAKRYEHKNQITACFGSGDAALMKIKTTDISEINSSTFVFTSDGIHDYISLDEFESVLISNTSYYEKCEDVISLAGKNGSTDDKSIIIGVM